MVDWDVWLGQRYELVGDGEVSGGVDGLFFGEAERLQSLREVLGHGSVPLDRRSNAPFRRRVRPAGAVPGRADRYSMYILALADRALVSPPTMTLHNPWLEEQDYRIRLKEIPWEVCGPLHLAL